MICFRVTFAHVDAICLCTRTHTRECCQAWLCHLAWSAPPWLGWLACCALPRLGLPCLDQLQERQGLGHNNNSRLWRLAAASPPQLLFLQRVLLGSAMTPRLECSALAPLARLLCLASARSALP